jgi:hypothetical protein
MGNDMWHVALEPGTTRMQDIILLNLDANDFETIGSLLSTSVLKSQVIEMECGSYLLMCNGEYERPYPSVMIWRVEISEEKSTVVDMRYEDGWIMEHVWKKWLMPEETDAEYVPPNRILVMVKY